MFFVRGLLGEGLSALSKRGPSVAEAADYGYDTALGMCGNDGQVSVIEMTGFGAFLEAAREASMGDDAASVLISMCPYPEAVGEILEEAGQVINEVMGEPAGDEEDEEGEEGEEGEEFEE